MTEKQKAAINRHGGCLLTIFQNTITRDPIELCRKLRRIEARGHALALRLCNGPDISEEALESAKGKLRASLAKLLGKHAVPVFLNMDPRGYALKIDSDWLRGQRESNQWPALRAAFNALESDWGGYGILAPEIGPQGWSGAFRAATVAGN